MALLSPASTYVQPNSGRTSAPRGLAAARTRGVTMAHLFKWLGSYHLSIVM